MLLLDVVLGYGADPDPAAALAPAILTRGRAAAERALPVVVSLIGTADDPQGCDRQARRAARPPAPRCSSSNAAATRHAPSDLLGGVLA